MVLLLTESEVAQAFGRPGALAECIDVVERGYLDESRDEGSTGPLNELLYPPTAKGRRDADISLMTSTGISRSAKAITGRMVPVGWSAERRKAGQPSTATMRFLWDFETLDLLCVMQEWAVYPYFVSGPVAVATRWLAQKDARSVGVIGSGRMAQASLRGVCAVRNIESVRIFSPNPAHRNDAAAAAQKDLGISASAVESPEAAVQGADVVVVATDAFLRGQAPVFNADWLTPGMLIHTLAPDELDEASHFKAKIVPSALHDELGRVPPRNPFKRLYDAGSIPEAQLPGDLAQIVSGQRAGRASADDSFIHLSAVTGPMAAAAARWAYEAAKANGIGTDWA